MTKVFVLLLLLFITPYSYATQLEGAWELVSGEYVDADGKLIDYQSIELNSLKIISTNHFSFTSVKEGKFWASGSGTYQLSNGKYKEVLNYNSFGESPGAEFIFTTKVDGEYWFNSRWNGDKRVEYEVWRRIE